MSISRDGTSEISPDPSTKSHIVAENDSLGVQNTLEIVYELISISTYVQIIHTCLQFSTRELARNNYYKWKNHFYKMKGGEGMSGHEKERKQEDAYTKTQSHS